MATAYNLKAGQTLSVTVDEGRAHVRCAAVDESVFTRSSASFGPARAYGAEGNEITVAYVDPGGTTAALSVSVYRQAITVSLARAANAITTTAAEIKTAIEAHGEANQLVTVALDESDTNFDSGAGIVTAMAADALESGAGTAIGVISPGGLLIDTENGLVYRNSGTLAAPAFTLLADDA